MQKTHEMKEGTHKRHAKQDAWEETSGQTKAHPNKRKPLKEGKRNV